LCSEATHKATDRTINDTRYVNPGSVSNHKDAGHDASYLLLWDEPEGVRLEHRTVAYDTQAIAAIARESGIPGAQYLIDTYYS
jgi:predicted phosphodiesterase